MLSQQQIDEIVQEIQGMPQVQGILITGSYVYGIPTKESDLDIRIITSDGSNMDDRNCQRFNTRIEAFYNTPERIREYFKGASETGDEVIIHLWTKGKIVYDPNGIMAILQQEAVEIWDQGPKKGKWITRPEYKEKMTRQKLSVNHNLKQ